MIDYKDPIPPVIKLLDAHLNPRVYGNTFINPVLPAVLVRTAGGAGYSRIQIVVRANSDIEAMKICIEAANILVRYASDITGLQVQWAERETNPITAVDNDTGKPEAWLYIRLEHLEG